MFDNGAVSKGQTCDWNLTSLMSNVVIFVPQVTLSNCVNTLATYALETAAANIPSLMVTCRNNLAHTHAPDLKMWTSPSPQISVNHPDTISILLHPRGLMNIIVVVLN